MVLIRVRYNEKSSCFSVRLFGLGDKIIACKFDTGAVATIITTKRLGVSNEQLELLKNYYEKTKIEPKKFYSATNGEMQGYPVMVANIKIGNVMIDKFYYYIVLSNDLDKALLGDDFISCCTFNHQSKNDILITTIDMDSYLLSYKDKVDCIDISEILMMQ